MGTREIERNIINFGYKRRKSHLLPEIEANSPLIMYAVVVILIFVLQTCNYLPGISSKKGKKKYLNIYILTFRLSQSEYSNDM